METTKTTATTKPLRADAQRNRDRLLQATIAMLPQKGTRLSLEAVARRAEVSIATLYRHFPTRETLILAVHHQEMTALADWARELATTHPAEQALQKWLHRLGHYGSTRPGLGEAFRSAALTGEELLEQTYETTIHALDGLITGAANTGHARSDIRAADVLLALCGVWELPDTPTAHAQTDRVVRLLLDGLRTPADAAPQHPVGEGAEHTEHLGAEDHDARP